MDEKTREYQKELKSIGVEWEPPTDDVIACSHEWDKSYRTGQTRTCIKCGEKQTN